MIQPLASRGGIMEKLNRKQEPMGDIVDFIVNTKYENLPSEVIEFGKQDLLNGIGIVSFGESLQETAAVMKLVKELGGKPQSRIIVDGAKVPAPSAALVMGTGGRASDLGDTHDEAGHLNEFIVPALLATADMLKSEGKTVTGKDLLTAHVLGLEVAGRVSRSIYGMSRNISKVVGGTWPLGSTAAVAKLMAADVATTRNAMGLARSSPNTLDWAGFSENTVGCRIVGAGYAARNGVFCALLAREGVTGTKGVFSGPNGLYQSLFPEGNDPTQLLTGLGEKWDVLTILFKPYMGCKFTHCPIFGSMTLVKENKIDIANIREIHCKLHPAAFGLVGQPREEKLAAKTLAECQFSLPYVIATGLITGKVFLDSYTEEALTRADVRRLMPKITASIDETLPVFSTVVTIRLTSGREYTRQFDYVKGSPQEPMSWDEHIEIFRDCIAHALKPISKRNIDQVINIVRNLEDCMDATKIISLLCGE